MASSILTTRFPLPSVIDPSQLPPATPSVQGALPARRDLNVVCIGDSHTAGMLVSAAGATDGNINAYDKMQTSPPTRDWTGTADSASPRLANNIAPPSTTWDPNCVASPGTAGSWTAWLAAALRSAVPHLLGKVRIANLGIGGASTYTFAGQQAQMYFNFSGIPTAGESVSIGGRTYTFRAAWGAADDVLIGTQAATAQWLGNVISGVTGYGATPNAEVFVPNPTAQNNYSPHCWARRTGTAGNSIACSSASAVVAAITADTFAATTHLTLGSDSNTVQSGALVGLVPAGFGTVDVVTVTLGTNDVGRIGYNVSDFAYEAAKLLALLHATYPSAKIVWWLPPVTGIAARNTLLTTVVIPALQALQVANQTLLYLVDVNSVSAGADLGVILGVDGVHLTNYGYSVAANAFAGGICKALGWQ